MAITRPMTPVHGRNHPIPPAISGASPEAMTATPRRMKPPTALPPFSSRNPRASTSSATAFLYDWTPASHSSARDALSLIFFSSSIVKLSEWAILSKKNVTSSRSLPVSLVHCPGTRESR